MARVKTIWGPSLSQTSRSLMSWRFTVVFEDGNTRSYRLTFFFDTRKFRARVAEKDGKADTYTRAMTERDLLSSLPEVQRAGVVEGRVTDLLRARLSPDQIAAATAAAIRWSMK